jgi:putative holliday junction resolvase
MSTFLVAAQTALANLKPGERLMGLDLGTKTIGIATSDITRSIATPRETIKRTKFKADVTRILEIADADKIALFVIGMPLNMDGTEGPRAQSTRSFQRNFAQTTGRTMIFWDERLSTAAVTRTMLEADMSRAKRADNVDKLAAAIVLQTALDGLNQHRAWSVEKSELNSGR